MLLFSVRLRAIKTTLGWVGQNVFRQVSQPKT